MVKEEAVVVPGVLAAVAEVATEDEALLATEVLVVVETEARHEEEFKKDDLIRTAG